MTACIVRSLHPPLFFLIPISAFHTCFPAVFRSLCTNSRSLLFRYYADGTCRSSAHIQASLIHDCAVHSYRVYHLPLSRSAWYLPLPPNVLTPVCARRGAEPLEYRTGFREDGRDRPRAACLHALTLYFIYAHVSPVCEQSRAGDAPPCRCLWFWYADASRKMWRRNSDERQALHI